MMNDESIQKWLDDWDHAGKDPHDLAELLMGVADLWTPDSLDDQSEAANKCRRLAGVVVAAAMALRPVRSLQTKGVR